MKEKFIKFILGLLMILLIFVGLFMFKPILFILSIIFIIIGLKEYRNLLSRIEIFPIKFLPEIFCILISFFLCISQTPYQDLTMIMPTLITGVILSFIISVILNKKPFMMTTFSTIAGILLTFCGLYLIKLTHLMNKTYPYDILLIYIIAIFVSNYVATLFDKKFKEGKLISKEINEEKTVAGAISHIVTSTILCTILSLLWANYNILFGITMGIKISIFAQLGNFMIYAIKKECGVENNKTFLNTMSSFIFSAPALFYHLMIIAILFKTQ